jgi:putative oxidoreductase
MKTAFSISRILLGLVFTAAGLSGFLLIANPPPMPPGLAGAFQDVFFKSHWVLFVDSVELVAGVLLLANRYVPLALTALAAVIANILVFHITMMPSGLPVAVVVAILWTIVALPFRAIFAPLFSQRPVAQDIDTVLVHLGHAQRSGASS